MHAVGDDGAIKDEFGYGNAAAQQSLDSLFKQKDSVGMGALGLDDDAFEQKQIADLYPNCTVMFADICGELPPVLL